jgi:hypothetical protein
MSPVKAVIPNTPKAERMILMLNKNIPSYIGNVLKDQGMPELFLLDLVKKSCCPTQLSEMANCTWYSDTGTLITHQEAAEEKNRLVLEMALWFKDAFANLGLRVDGKPKKPALPPETLFNLKDDRSVKTVHHCHEQAATAASSTPPWKGKSKVVKMASSVEESTSSSSQDGPPTTAAIGDEDSPTSSDEGNSEAPGVADDG